MGRGLRVPEPFFFLRGGLIVSLGVVIANLELLALLTAAKTVPKLALIFRRLGATCPSTRCSRRR